MSSGVRIPADIDRPDRILAGLTARQLAILAASGAVTWVLATTAAVALPLPVAVALAAPPALVGVALALGWRDGLPLDRLALAALRFRRRPRRLVPAPEGVAAPPAWTGSRDRPPVPLAGPIHNLHDDGVIDLGTDGQALLCRASAVNFRLRSQPEQQALIAAFARLLHAVTGPLTVVIRTDRVDLAATVAALRATATGLPHPALERAAGEHADFLADLAACHDVRSRERLLVLREPAGTPDPAAALARRAEQAATLLAAAGVTLTPLDQDAAARVLARAANPHAPPRPAGQAAPGAVITGRRR
jgi:PrgI family protein